MVYRVYVEKKKAFAGEALSLYSDLKAFLGIEGLRELRIINRYDVENIDKELFEYAVKTVFSEPQLDIAATSEPDFSGYTVFAVEYLPGQYDQRADSAAQCIQIISQGERPDVRTAKVYLLQGDLSEKETEQIKKYVINPVESREAALIKPQTLKSECEMPTKVETLSGFIMLSDKELADFIKNYGLAMDLDDIKFCRSYFAGEKRDPTITEIRMIDTYWSDHCRHTTFLTTIDSVKFEEPVIERAYNEYLEMRRSLGRTKPVNLMDIATVGARYLKAKGMLQRLDVSEEVNACTVKIKVNIKGREEDWLLLFKNETHNHPTEIEPFGGAATCIGGAIRDPLSGRAYVYAAMRVTGAADPTRPVSETLAGKLPQRKIVTTAAAGYSSYGNQIGLATGLVDEIYHDGYAAKRMEIGAVIAAAPEANVRRERPEEGDVVILLGGRTGRDGCGGATGSSKSHTLSSLESCGAEVQKGNAPEERKLQRLFRNSKASLLIKRCNDFGAGGVSVAIGELADGIDIDLDALPKKYEGLDGTELAISESQERMAVVVAKDSAESFCALAREENLEATVVARVSAAPRLTMTWKGVKIVDLSREFLNSNGAEKHIDIVAKRADSFKKSVNESESFRDAYLKLARDLNVCSKRGLSERFDSTIGAGTLLMPFGGKNQLTPIQAMAHKISVEREDTDTVSLMSWGYNPFISEKSPYHGAYLAVVESVSKLISAGAEFKDIYLTFQEYFEKPGRDPKRWGKPFAALLGALMAQKDLQIASVGGKDSMSGSFENIDVPPTLVSFAVTTDKVANIISGEFKTAGHRVALLSPEYDREGLPIAESLIGVFKRVNELVRKKEVLAAYTPAYGGAAEAVMKMSFGNGIGFAFDGGLSKEDLFGYRYGSFILELSGNEKIGLTLGNTITAQEFIYKDEKIGLSELLSEYESRLEGVFTCNISQKPHSLKTYSYKAESYPAPAVKSARPKVIIPVFPGTNCEYDTAKALESAGAEPEIIVIKNLTKDDIARSADAFAKALSASQMIFVPGGFSGGDEPDGSGKFITAFFRSAAVKEEVARLLERRDGLIAGVCNGFQALIKLGLVPYGKITDTDESSPTLTFNTIGRHQSRLVRTRISSNKSPWLSKMKVGDIVTVPVSHGEGRFIASDEIIAQLSENGQIATQYVDLEGNVTADIRFNPNNSAGAIEGITSPDGRVFGKMGHSERTGAGLYKNVPGNYDIRMFESAVFYFK